MPLPPSGDRLLISERFVSLQGEGVSCGAPAAFLRLGNCNLACTYCDTPYTWDASRYDLAAELHALPVDEVARWVAEAAPGRLIVTGGEPLLQHRLLSPLLEQIDALRCASRLARVCVEVETNGTIAPSSALLGRVDQWNVSPKLERAGESETRRIKAEVVSTFARLPQAFFKFVVVDENDVDEVERWIDRFGLERQRVQLMPEAVTPAQLQLRAKEVARLALKRGVRYSGRLHLELYGGRRGT